MARYRRRYYRRRYYNDYDYEDPIAGIFSLVFLYLLYKVFTNWDSFVKWTVYSLFGVGIVLISFLLYRYFRKNRFSEISRAASSLNNEIRSKFEKENANYLNRMKESEREQANEMDTEEKFSVWQNALYNALLRRGIKCYKEKWDGHKHIDIAIPWARLNIEVDGMQHYFSEKQMSSDIDRTFYSAQRGYKTIPVPNIMIEKNLDSIADNIANIALRQYFKRKKNNR